MKAFLKEEGVREKLEPITNRVKTYQEEKAYREHAEMSAWRSN